MMRILLVRTGCPLFHSLHHIPFLDGEDATLHSPSVLVCSQPLHLAFSPPSLLLSSCDLSAPRLLDKCFWSQVELKSKNNMVKLMGLMTDIPVQV